MKPKQFHFKQTSIYHHNSTMKVGTDAILLAVWCDVNNASNILDVGTGSGVIALLLATRSLAKVHAVELHEDSAAEAALNFKNYPANKILIFEDDFNNFAVNQKQKYDLIVSNPPFFTNSLLPDSKSRNAARHTNTLSHNQLCKGVTSLLSENGKFSLVLPHEIAINFTKIASKFNLHLHRQLVIHPKPNTLPNRINMEFRFKNNPTIITEKITIRNTNGEYSIQYKSFVKDYLIKI
jgi:tRNA1Val (adenine37-N6)-methyltransferase